MLYKDEREAAQTIFYAGTQDLTAGFTRRYDDLFIYNRKYIEGPFTLPSLHEPGVFYLYAVSYTHLDVYKRQLYADFVENEYCKIYSNEEFIYHEYAVMQTLQRSYAIAEDHIQTMLSKDSLSSFYDSAKVEELENMAEPTGKDIKKLEAYQNNSPVYEATTVSDEVNYSPCLLYTSRCV